jgi:hypothetical protein
LLEFLHGRGAQGLGEPYEYSHSTDL